MPGHSTMGDLPINIAASNFDPRQTFIVYKYEKYYVKFSTRSGVFEIASAG